MAKNRLFQGYRLAVRGSALRRLHIGARVKRSALFTLFLFGSALFSVRAIDSNNDGMSDIWQRLYGVADGSASNDADGDGFTNLQESLLGTDPDDASSAIHLQVFPQSGNNLRLRMETVVGKLYQIESSEDLVHSASAGQRGHHSCTNPSTKFYFRRAVSRKFRLRRCMPGWLCAESVATGAAVILSMDFIDIR